MKVLQKAKGLAEGRIRSWCALIGFVGLGLLVFAASYPMHSVYIESFAAVIIILSLVSNMNYWKSWFAEKRSQSKVSKILTSLPAGYVVLSDLVLPDSKAKVNHLAIGPNGLFAIETKNYSGYVKCDEEQWLVNGHKMQSLSKQVKRKSLAVRSSIGILFTQNPMKIPYVVPLLVFVNPLRMLKLSKPTVSVLKVNELAEFIRDYKGREPITTDERCAIVQHLQSLQPIPGEPSDYPAATEDRLYGAT